MNYTFNCVLTTCVCAWVRARARARVCVCVCVCKNYLTLFIPCCKFRSLYLSTATATARAAEPFFFLNACGIFVVFGIVNVHTNVDACEYTRGLYGHRKGVCTDS